MALQTIEVASDRPVSSVEMSKIQDILVESKCEYESLKNSIDGVTGFSGGVITIGTGVGYRAYIEI